MNSKEFLKHILKNDLKIENYVQYFFEMNKKYPFNMYTKELM